MITIEKLRAFGANVDEGLGRCFNNEEFYLKLVNMVRNEKNFDLLDQALTNNDLNGAFEAAHALKGVLGNLSMTPILDPVVEITELLRAKTDMDYSALQETIRQKKEEFFALFD